MQSQMNDEELFGKQIITSSEKNKRQSKFQYENDDSNIMHSELEEGEPDQFPITEQNDLNFEEE